MTDEQQDARAGGGRGGRGTVGDMVRSLLVIFAIVAAVLVLMPRPNGDTVRLVDWRPFALKAQGGAAYEVLEPSALPTGWRSTSAQVAAAPGGGSVAWTVGFVTPEDAYAALAQSDGDTRSYVADFTKQGAREGTVRVAGRAWERRSRQVGKEERRSLVRDDGDSVVLVTGTARWAELERLAGALRPRTGG